MFVSRRVRGHGVRTGTSAAAEGRSKTIAAASEGDLDGRALDVETPHVGVDIRVLGKEATRCVGAGALGRARAQARLGFGALAALVVALPLRWSRPNPNPVNLHGQDSRAWPPGESVSKAIPKRVRAILINSFRLMQIRGPWLAYVLVRQLCFIVADEDVRHAQPPQSQRYSENNSNPI